MGKAQACPSQSGDIEHRALIQLMQGSQKQAIRRNYTLFASGLSLFKPFSALAMHSVGRYKKDTQHLDVEQYQRNPACGKVCVVLV